MEQIYLSRRNLLTLLSKLDRLKQGDETSCTIIKYDNTHSVYPQTMEACMVTAIEDDNHNDGSVNHVYIQRWMLNRLLELLEGRSLRDGTKMIPQIIIGYEPLINLSVIAVEDQNYYIDRDPGAVHPKDTV